MINIDYKSELPIYEQIIEQFKINISHCYTEEQKNENWYINKAGNCFDKCNNKCKNCSGPSEHECLSCEEDKYYYKNECIDKYSDVSDNSVEEKKNY